MLSTSESHAQTDLEKRHIKLQHKLKIIGGRL
jgi:hypothetical protein